MIAPLRGLLPILLCAAVLPVSGSLQAGPDTRTRLAEIVSTTPEYNLAIRLLPESHRMEVSGTLRLPPSDTTRTSVELSLAGSMKDLHFDVVEPAECAGPADMVLGPKDEDHPRFPVSNWILRPKRPFPSKSPIQLRLSYQGGNAVGFTFYLGPEGCFGGPNGVWYPQLEEGRGVGRLSFSAPSSYTILSTGAERDTSENEGSHTFVNSVPTRFAFAAGRYSVVKRGGVVPMRLYLLRPRSNSQAYLTGASAVLSALSREFGAFPYPTFAIAEVPSDQAHEAGFSGASMNGFMLANGAALDAPFNLAYYGHEIGHQWWGNLITHEGSPWGDYMLDEGMAQFGSLRVVETTEGAAAAETYRRRGYPGYSTSQCGYGYLLSSEMGKDHALENLPNDVWSHELADSKGFLVLDLLSRTVGRDRFRNALHGITSRYAFRSLSWKEFLAAVQRVSNQDLSHFYTQWFGYKGAPEWRVAWKQEGGLVHGTVTQQEPFYRQRMDVEVRSADGTRAVHTLDVRGASTPFSWPTTLRADTVELDPHFHVLHWVPGLRGAALARAPALRAFQLSDAGMLDSAEVVLRTALAAIPQPDPDGARYWTEYSLGCLMMKKKDWAQARLHLDAAIAAPTRDPDTLPVLYWQYARTAKSLNDDAAMRWAVEAAVSADVASGGRTGAQYWAPALLTEK